MPCYSILFYSILFYSIQGKVSDDEQKNSLFSIQGIVSEYIVNRKIQSILFSPVQLYSSHRTA